MASTTDLLIKGDGTVPTSQVQIVISSPRNGSCETNTIDSSDDECLTPLTQNPSSTNNEFNAAPNRWHRRNSISLPAGLDAITSESPGYETQLTPENVIHGTGGYDTSDTFSEVGTSDDDSCHIGSSSRSTRLYGRNARRKSVAPPSFRLKDNGLEYSPHNSVTSINSIASLLKEKIAMTLPNNLRKRKPPAEYYLKIFIGFLFLLIIFIVTFSRMYYYQYVLQHEYFPHTRFNKEEKFLKLYNLEGVEIAFGHLGMEIPETDQIYECIPSENKHNNSVCFEWMDHARIRLNYENRFGSLHCYNIRWYSLSKDIHPMDCYEDGSQYGHWYGGGRTLGMAWPVELGTVAMSPFITGHIGHQRWGTVLKRYFINSKGVAILVDPRSPLHVSINAQNETKLCLKGKYDGYTFTNSLGQPTLNYTICSSQNIKTLHLALLDKPSQDDFKKSDSEIITSLLTQPVWQLAPRDKEQLVDKSILNLTEDVTSLGFLKHGHVLLNEFWQNYVGDFTFDEQRFASIKDIIGTIHRRGFRIILTIQPFISTESVNFAEAVREELLIIERGAEESRRVPALTRYKSLISAGMLDITNNMTQSWLQNQLRKLRSNYNIDAFSLDLGSAYDLPKYYEFKKNLTNPDHFKALFVESTLATVPVLGVSSAISRPPAPIFLVLPSLEPTWESLNILIPTVLTYGIIGYPFLIPGPIGGDYITKTMAQETGNENANTFQNESSGELPERELYIRWLELAAFLPVCRYSYLPSQYDKEVLDLAKNLTILRQEKVNSLLQKYVKEALETGTPLIRPLWMLDPTDTTCHTVNNEFSVGDELIVAPILDSKSESRDVYLPAGIWLDGINGSLRKGSRWLHHYRASLYQIPYFIRMPNNTRF